MPLPEIPYDEWFHDKKDNPLDSMPIATNKGGFDWEDTAPCEYEPPDVEVSNTPEGGGSRRKDQLEDVTIHEKMYRIATARYNPFAIGGSENCDSDISCNIGGSENVK